MINDGGGEFFAARKPVRGVERILLFCRKTQGPGIPRVRVAVLNGMPAALFERRPYREGVASRVAFLLELDAAGRVRFLHFVIAPDKLDHRLFEGLRRPGPRDLAAVLFRRVRTWRTRQRMPVA